MPHARTGAREPDSSVVTGVRAVAMKGVERGHGHKVRCAAKPCKSLPVGDFRRIILQGTQRYSWRRNAPEKFSPDSRNAPESTGLAESRGGFGLPCPPSVGRSRHRSGRRRDRRSGGHSLRRRRCTYAQRDDDVLIKFRGRMLSAASSRQDTCGGRLLVYLTREHYSRLIAEVEGVMLGGCPGQSAGDRFGGRRDGRDDERGPCTSRASKKLAWDLTSVGDSVCTMEPSRAEPSRAEPSRAEPSRAEPSRAEPSRAEPSRAEPSRAEPSRAEPLKAGVLSAIPII